MKYQNKKNGKVATLVEQNEKFKTVMLEFEDGSSQSITSSTFKRWWKKLDDDSEYVLEVMKQKQDLGIEVPTIRPEDVEIVDDSDKCGDGTPFSTVMEEIQKGAKKRVSQKEKTDAGIRDRAFAELKGYLLGVSSVTEVREWTKYSLAVKLLGKAFMEVRTVKSGSYTVYVKEDVAKDLGLSYNKINNYYLPAVIKNASLDTIKPMF